MKSKNLVNELKYLGILFLIAVVILKILFYKEGFVTTIRTAFAILWMFTLPGYAIMYYWQEKLSFLERFIIGTALGFAVIGMASYYLGILGLNIKYHAIVLPLIFIFAGVFFSRKKLF